MSDETKKPSEEGKEKSAIDLTKYVPKEDYEKLDKSTKDLEAKLDEAKLSLLDPEYIAYQESKKEIIEDKGETTDIDKRLKTYDEKFQKMGMTLENVLAVLELRDVKDRYSDFEDYRDDARKILESSQTPLTIEQAYKLAKQQKAEAKPAEQSEEEKAKGAKSSTEKPTSTVSSSEMQTKTFKTKQDAAEDAWNQVVGSGKDII